MGRARDRTLDDDLRRRDGHAVGLARLLAGDSVDTAIDRTRTAAEGAARSAERLLDDPEDFAQDLAAWHGDREVMVLLGRGPARAATELGALVLKESGVMAESLESGSFRHGPLELAGPNMTAIVMATEPETRRLDSASRPTSSTRGRPSWSSRPTARRRRAPGRSRPATSTAR